MVSPRSWFSTSGLIVGRPIKRALCVDTPRIGAYNDLSPTPDPANGSGALPGDRICERYGREGGPRQPRMPEEPRRLRDDAGAVGDERLRVDDGRGRRGRDRGEYLW